MGANHAGLRAALLAWYDEHRRDLPWRGDGVDPYRVWLSEVMLQQTRVETVRPYFQRWIEVFPDLESIARASVDQVLKAWEGLGYYSRARNFHRAVREVVERYGGTIPADPAVFRTLPGVGRYTAGAVMSIAFQREEPVVDGNVRRVFARILDRPDPEESELWRFAEELVAGPRPGDLNQAVMELGALVCTSRTPDCARCPLDRWCGAKAAGTVAERPARRARPPVPTESYGVAVIEWEDRLLLRRRPPEGRLGGLWEFPSVTREEGEPAAAAAIRAAEIACEVAFEDTEPAGSVQHRLSHVQLVYEVFRLSRPAKAPVGGRLHPEFVWADPAAIDRLALSRAQRRIAELIDRRSATTGGPTSG